jgi:hypothetical protein
MTQEEIGQSLLAAGTRVPDRRSVHGRRHPLPAILALSTAALLSGARSRYAIAQWGRAQPPEVVHARGFTRARPPAVATWHATCKALNSAAGERAREGWAAQIASRRVRGSPARVPLALDGKGRRGIHGEELPGVRLVALYDVHAGRVLAQTGGQDPRRE